MDDHEGGSWNGHTLERHDAKSEEWFKERFEKEKFLRSATSFPDIETGNRATREVMRQNAEKIAEWTQTSKAQKGEPKGFFAELEEVIGFGVNKAGIQKDDIKKVRIVLKLFNGEIKVYTSFPEYD